MKRVRANPSFEKNAIIIIITKKVALLKLRHISSSKFGAYNDVSE